MIIIPKMEKLPDNCYKCPLSYFDNDEECWCPWHNCTVDYYGGEDRRMEDCPLAESDDE